MHRFVLSLTLMFLFLPGCSRKEVSGTAGIAQTNEKELITYLVAPPASGMQAVSHTSSSPQSTEANTLSVESKIIKTAHLEFQVNDIEQSKRRISHLVNAEKGYIANLEESNDRARIRASFTIRVPAAGFDVLVESILKEGIYVGNASIERKDVTEEYLDLKARMETKKALEARYRQILQQAKNVEEILKVEQALGALREEIEAKEGRIKFLDHQVEYSTIHAGAYQVLPYSPPPKSAGQGFTGRLASSLTDGWSGFVDFMFDLLSIWPALIIFCALLYLIVRWIKRLRHRGVNREDSARPPSSKS
jgi:hypothetical protein